jgi:hypothetical protein
MWPGKAESNALGIDLNEFHIRGLHLVFFVKPTLPPCLNSTNPEK